MQIPKNSSTDILIVGAGPAGSACALMLARKGVSCVIVDKATFPRDKICGDALSLDVVNQLSMIDSKLGERFESMSEKVPSYGVKMISPGGYSVDLPLYKNGNRRCGYVCERLEFDNFLVEEFLHYPEYIQFYPSTQVTSISFSTDGVIVEAGDNSIKANLVIAADGAHSFVNKYTQSIEVDKEHYCAGLRQYYTGVKNFHQENFIELHFFKELLPGYLWIFPLPNGKANVGVGILSSEVSRKKINLKEVFKKLLNEHPSLKDRFSEAKPLETVKGYGLPLGSKKRTISGERFMLIGDAASLIDPFSGEGIANAIRSGRIAAEVAFESISSKNFSAAFLKQYDRKLFQKIWMELKVSRKIQQLCKYAWLFDFIVKRTEKSLYLKSFLKEALENVHKKKIMTGPRFLYHLFFKNTPR